MFKINSNKLISNGYRISRDEGSSIRIIEIKGEELDLDETYDTMTPALEELKEKGLLVEVEYNEDFTEPSDFIESAIYNLNAIGEGEHVIKSYELLYSLVIESDRKDDVFLNEDEDEYYLRYNHSELALNSSFNVDLLTGNSLLDEILLELKAEGLLTPYYNTKKDIVYTIESDPTVEYPEDIDITEKLINITIEDEDGDYILSIPDNITITDDEIKASDNAHTACYIYLAKLCIIKKVN